MDETSYSDPGAISLINSLFVPVRLDTDQRPDVNLRYNMGGWPSTVFLTPEGDILAGGTYIRPEDLRRLLETVSTVYHTRKVDIATAILEERQRQARQQPASGGPVGRHVVTSVVDLLVQEYDREHGGFGNTPKFPETDALELLLYQHRTTGEGRYLAMLTNTLQAMANGGMFDPVAGGFFRYSTTADWSVPHYEKMLEDNVRLLAVYSGAYALTGDQGLAATASRVVDYLMSTLYQPELGAYSGSQDADEEYYHLSADERARRPALAVDGTIYTPWNARAALSLLLASRALERPALSKLALRVVRFLWDKCRDRDRGICHYYSGARPQVLGLLADQVWMAQALVAAYEATGSALYLRRAQRLAAVMERDFLCPEAGFFDRMEEAAGQGLLRRRLRVLEENAAAAEVLQRLYIWTGDLRYKDLALSALQGVAGMYLAHGRLAAGYALAVARCLDPAVVIKVSRADSSEGRELYRASLRLTYPNVLLRPLARREAEDGQPYALVCLEDRCLPPIRESAELERTLAQLLSPVP